MAWFLVPGVAISQEQGSSPPPDLAGRPYSIRAWVSVDPGARMGPATARDLVDDWLELARRFVGSSWQIELQDGEGPLRGRTPADLVEEAVAPRVDGAEKGWFLRIEPSGSGGGYTLVGREFDATTLQFGPLYRQPAPFPGDAPRSLFELSRRVFSPIAEIERTEGGVELLVQGASLPGPDPVGRVVVPGTVFRPYYVFLGPKNSVREIRSIPFTYLHVEDVNGPTARCEVVSGLRRPLPKQVAGRYRLVALGITPADVPTRFRFVAGEGDRQHPAAGYVLTARGIRDRVVTEVGTTDREGRVSLPPRFSDDLVVLRLMAGGVEPLREFPVLPGETAEEREVPVEPRPEAVALEFRLKALQDEVVDLIARRGVLEARLDSRASGQAWDEVKRLLDEYLRLTPRREFEDRLARLTEDARRDQAELGVPILTRTAQSELAEVRALVERYLDDEAYNAYLEAYRQSQQQAGAPDSSGSSNLVARSPSAPPAVAPRGGSQPANLPPESTAPDAPPPPAPGRGTGVPAPEPASKPKAQSGTSIPF
ncbi:hypothetical protein ElP_49610 [Tautonia plasticadhaerens]|uniref:Uncharacterized protein n=2 Tax=Tautonia plasticadhaerens TaxID=2527974 RepID=A0A518H835_9BACT|nr:hypothetical protein ElP_49610 [Tautonia plasticadhaerens]